MDLQQLEWYKKHMADPKYKSELYAKRREERAKNRAETRRKHRERYAKNPSYYYSRTEQWAKDNPEKVAAGTNARRYAKKRDHCEVCGAKNLDLVMHHEDYTRPLDVLTLCETCHKRVHAGVIKLPTPEPILTPKNERHCPTCSKNWPQCGRKQPSTGASFRYKGKYGCVRWMPFGIRTISELVAESKLYGLLVKTVQKEAL